MGVAHETFNHVEIILGRRGFGKSTRAVMSAFDLATKSGGAYIIAHDMGRRLPRRLPDGRATGVQWHATTEDASKALATSPGGIHAITSSSAEEVIALGKRLGEASLARARNKIATPVIIIIDEGANASGMRSYRIEEEFVQFLAGCRWLHCALFVTCQTAAWLHYSILNQATHLTLMRTLDQKALDRLEEAGISEDVIARLPTLPKYEAITVNLDE